MTNDNNRPTWKPFSAYLERLAQQREARGEPSAPEVHDDAYWRQWHEQNSEKDK